MARLDWEVELALVIGRTAHRIDPAVAAGAIAGDTIGIDLSARDRQFDPRSPVTPDVFGGQAFDGSCPLSPWIVPSAVLPALQALALTREPGDVILTETPAGTGVASGGFLSAGDRIDATIEGIGTLSITVGSRHA